MQINIDRVAIGQEAVSIAKDLLENLLANANVPLDIRDRIYRTVDLTARTASANTHEAILRQLIANKPTTM
jgi:N-methylhydantoinase B/oxoprolinase/acetone carboxylase alpha subunit